MNYKNILLAMLLVPLAAIGKNTTAARIQELDEKIFQKHLELSNLGTAITEKEELLALLKSEMQDRYALIIDKKTKELEEKNGGKSLSPDEGARLYTELRDELQGFYQKLDIAFKNKENITGMLVNGLFQEDDFQSLRFYLIRYAFEHEILKRLVKKYEILIQEWISIETELEKLKK
jgi:hypothetical protein